MTNPQTCLACGERPAKPGSGTVPLCSQCQALAKGGERGVKFTGEKNEPKEA